MQTLEGTVVRLHGHHAWIIAGDREYLCPVRGKFKQGKRRERSPVAVGDVVEFEIVQETDQPEGHILTIRERRTELYRAHPRFPRQRQVIAANIDLLVIVCGADQLDEQLLTVDRLLISALSQGLTPIIVVNKCDLAQPEVAGYAHAEVFKTCATSGELAGLKGRFAGRTAVFAGPSGVGKSSLLNALEPGLALKVGEVDRQGEGKHTTTHATMLPLAGGHVIDTPGVRDFPFWNLEPHEISLYYPDWEQPRQQCKFATCTHRHEPQCGVKAAVEAGTLDQGRYQRYLTILREHWNQQEAAGY
ncbi:MAG: ribosome small subunit-dependent GTPase A [Planctomycetes bacterium]|nr:ribosome small subunit-dependent GTPase A [Planctomycetota bacterium]MCW8136094.1 ribosome small subunit-dependent GTPase A [Planctomycetota bacterium]